MHPDHSHPELEAGLKRATDVLLDIRALLDTRLTGLDARLGGLETRFAALEARFATLEARFATLDTRLSRIERILNERLGRNGPGTN